MLGREEEEDWEELQNSQRSRDGQEEGQGDSVSGPRCGVPGSRIKSFGKTRTTAKGKKAFELYMPFR